MMRSLPNPVTERVLSRLKAADGIFRRSWPGDSADRQPVHVVYGGAHLFKADLAQKVGRLARRYLDHYGPTAEAFAQAVGLKGDEELVRSVYSRVKEKLDREPVEDYRIDFEDGYGFRPDAEEDGHAESCAAEVAKGMAAASLPPFIGIRVKSLSEETCRRSMRTLDIFVTALARKAGARLSRGFVVTLPKVIKPEQVSALAVLLKTLEDRNGLKPGSLKMEIMMESPRTLFAPGGNLLLPELAHAAEGRCVAVHLGVFDYTASLGITAAHQGITHPACDFARQIMQASLAGTGIRLSDGATNVLPVERHRTVKDGPPLTPDQETENRQTVHHAWKLSYENIRHALESGFYQGWDLHPAQLPVRYAAVYAFFLEGLAEASARLTAFIDTAARATRLGDVFDDAGSGQGLLNYFLRALNCGAVTGEEIGATGLSVEEIRNRSFVKIVEGRK